MRTGKFNSCFKISLKNFIILTVVIFVLQYILIQYFYYSRIEGHKLKSKSRWIIEAEDDKDIFSVEIDPPEKLIIIEKKQFLVDTPSCKIPVTETMPQYYKDVWNNLERIENKIERCDDGVIFEYVTQELIELKHPGTQSCFFQEILRDPKSDNEFLAVKLSDTPKLQFGQRINVSNTEMFMVTCNNSHSFGATIPTKEKANLKIKFWKKKLKNFHKKRAAKIKQPTSILILGFDTTSRLHFHRSLPKTVKLLKEMKFLDFQGYHSIYPGTKENFVGFLMGLTVDEQKNVCQTDWKSPVDSCPFIWKEFYKQNYVSMFIEDWVGTFNWGGQGGFTKTPVDYYIHPLFLAQQFYTKDALGNGISCFSNDSTPQFLLRYTQNFLQKFNETPFFTFTWMGYPFHEDDSSLSRFDDSLLNFFLHLKQDPNLFRRTLIILLGDHGDRYGSFSSYSLNAFESFVERSLPPLFIRIPENLQEHYPELKLKEFSEKNTKLLTTPFDVHQTLIHILELNQFDLELFDATKSQQNLLHPQVKQQTLSDRSSLFSFIPDTRTCDQVHISGDFCVCNTNAKLPSIENSSVLDLLVEFAIYELNLLVNNSKYRETCSVWEKPQIPIISSNVLNRDANSTLVLIKFMVFPNWALFQVQLQVIHDKFRLINNLQSDNNEIMPLHNFEGISRIGDIFRINSYGDSSWCVRSEDKFMKNFCNCLEDKLEEIE